MVCYTPRGYDTIGLDTAKSFCPRKEISGRSPAANRDARSGFSLRSPVRANRTPGSVRGAPGNRCLYLDINELAWAEFSCGVAAYAAMMAATAATLTMSSAEQPRERSWAGLAIPCTKGPNAWAPPIRSVIL